MLRPSIIAIGCVLLLAGCGPASDRATGGDDPRTRADIDGAWRLVDGRGPRAPIPTGEDIEITLELEGASIVGRAACNRYFADAVRSSGRFHVRGVGSTEMACSAALMDAERLYLRALGAVESQRMEGNVLVLFGPQVELLYKERPAPD